MYHDGQKLFLQSSPPSSCKIQDFLFSVWEKSILLHSLSQEELNLPREYFSSIVKAKLSSLRLGYSPSFADYFTLRKSAFTL